MYNICFLIQVCNKDWLTHGLKRESINCTSWTFSLFLSVLDSFSLDQWFVTGSHDGISSISSAVIALCGKHCWGALGLCNSNTGCVTFYIFNHHQVEYLDPSYLEQLSVIVQPTQGPEGDLWTERRLRFLWVIQYCQILWFATAAGKYWEDLFREHGVREDLFKDSRKCCCFLLWAPELQRKHNLCWVWGRNQYLKLFSKTKLKANILLSLWQQEPLCLNKLLFTAIFIKYLPGKKTKL